VDDNTLVVENLIAHYLTSRGPVRAVDGVDLRVPRGRSLGLIGESGCGKSSIALTLLRLLPAPGEIIGGRVLLEGDDLLAKTEEQMEKIRWRKVALIPQGAMNSLNPVHTVGQQIMEAITTHERGVGERAVRERAADALRRVGIDELRLSAYPHEFSGGMKQRAAIAMALVCRPALIIADESTNGLDVITQAQVLGLIRELRRETGTSFLMISHDLYVVAAVCDLVAVMYAGKVVEVSPVATFRTAARHPYSRALAAAFPDLTGPRRRIETIPGTVPSLLTPPQGCRFHPRCPEARPLCGREEPAMRTIDADNRVACHLVEDQAHGTA
jgi:oligopeptide/dipeptide ABC transporter ATP-binding protein